MAPRPHVPGEKLVGSPGSSSGRKLLQLEASTSLSVDKTSVQSASVNFSEIYPRARTSEVRALDLETIFQTFLLTWWEVVGCCRNAS